MSGIVEVLRKGISAMLSKTRLVSSTMKRSARLGLHGFAAALIAVVVITSSAPVDAARTTAVSHSTVVVEWNSDGTAAPGDEIVGHARLRRSADGIGVTSHITGLRPGGVYTFWWVVVQDDGEFPNDIYVDGAGGTIVGPSGVANNVAWAPTGDAPIVGFPAIGDAEFASLNDPLESIVRIEIAYHGQSAEAGSDLDRWLGDFWTGAACPPQTPNPNPHQPHCPVYYAATFAP